MLNLILLSSALAAPSGYKVTKTDTQGCELSLGPADAQGVVPMRAECRWPEVTLERFKAAFSAWDQHDEMFSTVAESRVQRSEADRTLVYQRHTTSGIADREIVLWMKAESVDGYDRFSWARADGEALTPAKGNVLADKSTGYWQAKAAPEGGIVAIHHLYYGPGGSVPGFVVRWFQTSGLETTVTEARAFFAK